VFCIFVLLVSFNLRHHLSLTNETRSLIALSPESATLIYICWEAYNVLQLLSCNLMSFDVVSSCLRRSKRRLTVCVITSWKTLTWRPLHCCQYYKTEESSQTITNEFLMRFAVFLYCYYEVLYCFHITLAVGASFYLAFYIIRFCHLLYAIAHNCIAWHCIA